MATLPKVLFPYMYERRLHKGALEVRRCGIYWALIMQTLFPFSILYTCTKERLKKADLQYMNVYVPHTVHVPGTCKAAAKM